MTKEIAVSRTFADFDDLWTTTCLVPGIGRIRGWMSRDASERLKARVWERLSASADGRVTYAARANAVKGIVPGHTNRTSHCDVAGLVRWSVLGWRGH